MDDHSGTFCKMDKFPILKSVSEELENKYTQLPKIKSTKIMIDKNEATTSKTTKTMTTTLVSKVARLTINLKQPNKTVKNKNLTFPALFQVNNDKFFKKFRLTECVGFCRSNKSNKLILSRFFNMYFVFYLMHKFY